jgi:hypothetical protein
MVQWLETNQFIYKNITVLCDIFKSKKRNSLVLVLNNRNYIFNNTNIDTHMITISFNGMIIKPSFIKVKNNYVDYFTENFHMDIAIIENFPQHIEECIINFSNIVDFETKILQPNTQFEKCNVLTTIEKNELHLVDSWITYHKKIGFNKFIIYDNGSTVNLSKIDDLQEKYNGEVFFINANWPYFLESYGNNTVGQVIQQNHCIWKFCPETLGLLDLDEYLHSDTKIFNKDATIISLPNKWFGCGKTSSYDETNFLDKLINCEKNSNEASNRKCIINSKNVDLFCVHEPITYTGEYIFLKYNDNFLRHYMTLGWKRRFCDCSVFCAEKKTLDYDK